MSRPFRWLLATVALLATSSVADAQVRPNDRWLTFETAHFRIHFVPELEELARRTAWNAEVAWEQLARELPAPRTPVDIVVADYADYANGFATPFPTNRIVIFARPPVEDRALRNHADWNALLVTHELAHVFHLDRARGWWAGARRVFGRAAPFFPNTYAPAWVIEGLAVHYETKLTGGGRLAGTEFPLLVRAAAHERQLPRLDALSLGAPHFPGGNVAYVYGAYLMDRAEPGAIGRFVEAQSGRLLPWRQDANARKAFGERFTDGFARWRDSVSRAESGAEPGRASGERVLTTHTWGARFPRWVAADALVYVADDQRQTPGAYRIGLDGRRERIGRRNSSDANAPYGHAGLLQAELDRTDPYTVTSDLYESYGGGRERLTWGERLSAPDVHRQSGRVVAVQSVPGSTQLVTRERGAELWRVIARGSLDVAWSEPRWSHSGRFVAAARWAYGGRTSIVVLDPDGRRVREFSPRGETLSIASSPAWVPGDTMLVFVSDHEGRPSLYLGDVRTGAYARFWESATGVTSPDVSADGRRVAAVETRADGMHIVVRDLPTDLALTLPAADTLPGVPVPRPMADTAARWQPYRAWPTLLPTWWLPSVGESDAGTTTVGGFTAMSDALGRHRYRLAFVLDLEHPEDVVQASYMWAGLGNPIFSVGVEQDWRHGRIVQAGTTIGTLAQRTRMARADALYLRPRVRLSTYVAAGVEVEWIDYRAYPSDTLRRGLENDAFRRTTTFPTLVMAVGASTMQRPGLSVSVEDGLAVQHTARIRYRSGLQYEDLPEFITVGQAAKSIPFPGFARHVVAVRAAYGHGDHRATTALTAGGTSGTSLEILPGITFGDSRRDFFVRGFAPGAQLGVRAAAASVEYRAPIALIGRGVGLLPTYAQKVSLTAFADGGMAWCELAKEFSFICRDPVQPRAPMVSVGGELALDASLQYDVIYRFRFGVAHPVRHAEFAARATSFYVSLGSAF